MKIEFRRGVILNNDYQTVKAAYVDVYADGIFIETHRDDTASCQDIIERLQADGDLENRITAQQIIAKHDLAATQLWARTPHEERATLRRQYYRDAWDDFDTVAHYALHLHQTRQQKITRH